MALAEQATTDPTDLEAERRSEYVAKLRALADFYEHSTLPAPYGDPSARIYATPEQFPALVKELGGERSKDASDDYLGVKREVHPGVTVEVFTDRAEVCERRVVGVAKVMVPDPSAPLVEVEREVYEWDCKPVLDRRARGLAGVAGLRGAAAEARAAG